ncbi:MAG: cystathionine gamma-synthase [Cyclobacteriaceae bacterium]|jgi:cystathionine beta-lyase|nr:cystathionine gamma-synthase [Cyclobacteriaceae bacterium]
MKFGTKAVHAGVRPDPTTGAIMTPIYQTSTYVQESPAKHKGYAYARGANPTRDALQASIAALEGGKYGLCFSSGMGATDAVIRLLSPGDEVITSNDLYGGSYRMFRRVYERFGIKFHFLDLTHPENITPYVNEKTKLFWLETPTNPLMNIVDIAACVDLAKENGVRVAVDNTFASPYLQNPLNLGADIVMHSVTKYLAGHSDVIMGALVTNDEALHSDLAFILNSCGAVPGPQDCFLVLRGIKTLHLRMERHCANGREVARFLRDHPKVGKVYWPGFDDHPNHDVACRQMRDFGGMISFSIKDDDKDKAIKLMENVKLFSLAESLGGVESLINHPASMTHASVPREDRLKSGLADSLIRLSVGIEDIEDLLADLQQALNMI